MKLRKGIAKKPSAFYYKQSDELVEHTSCSTMCFKTDWINVCLQEGNNRCCELELREYLVSVLYTVLILTTHVIINIDSKVGVTAHAAASIKI